MTGRRRGVAATALTLAALTSLTSLAGCGGARAGDYERALAEAHRASSAGRFAEAAEAYGRASGATSAPRGKEHAALLAALERARAGDVARALAELDALAKASPPTSVSAEAEYKAARLRLRTGAEARGRAELEAFLTRHPESPLALPALAQVLRTKEESSGEAGARALVVGLASKVPEGTPLGQRVAYERALRTEGLPARRDALIALADRFPYPRGSYWDDALFRASEIEEELGRPREAIALLTRLLAERETSDVIGSYQRPRYTPAKLRVAKLQEKLGDREGARRTLHELYGTFRSSDLRDDALWNEARLFREDHQPAEACDRLRTLVSELHDSRFVPCAIAVCPEIARPKESRAPKTCHAYLLRGESAAATPRDATE